MKFVGTVGFFEDYAETDLGIWSPVIVERKYYGDVLRDNRRFQPSNSDNDEFTASNRISILSDLYSLRYWGSIRYVIWNDVKWKVTSVEVNYPRITLELGGVYNGRETEGTA